MGCLRNRPILNVREDDFSGLDLTLFRVYATSLEVVRLHQLLRLAESQEERVADRLANADLLGGSEGFSY